jgi:L-histidine Nalpha-methyltransferase
MVAPELAGNSTAQLAEDVRAGLSKKDQKELPAKYFYDDVGSELFEAISVLPEYGLTRADERLLRVHTDAMAARIPPPVVVAELGSGSGKKTGWLLRTICRRRPTVYYPIEISSTALARCEADLRLIDSISIVGLQRDYLDGLHEVAARRTTGEHILVLFLGSSIGNFDRTASGQFLQDVRGILEPGDSLLLGTDLEKPVPKLILAYDDPLGVTAAFNLNLLARINRELDANFDLKHFKHIARFNHDERRIEMHLRSTLPQTVTIPKAGITVSFRKNETIWTESSHKYNLEEVARMATQAEFKCDAQWVDAEWPFAESLFIAQ